MKQHDLDSLTSRHQSLEADIHDEQRRPVPDNLKLQSLKRLKLKIKEQIEVLRPNRGQPAAIAA